MGKKKLLSGRRLVTLGGLAYGVLNDPRGRAAVARGLEKGASALRGLEVRHEDPTRSTFTGKSVGVAPLRTPEEQGKRERLLAGAEKASEKIPAGTFEKGARLLEEGAQKLQGPQGSPQGTKN